MFKHCQSLKLINLTNCNYILKEAFNGCTSLNEIIIPKVKMIFERAFSFCCNLIEIKFPKTLQSLHKESFSNCYKLEYITFNSIEPIYVEKDIFLNCSKLRLNKYKGGLYISSTYNNYYALIDSCENYEKLITHKDTKIIIPNSNIKRRNHIKKIVLNEGIYTIEESTFLNFKSLESVILPNSLSLIMVYSFYGCDKLKKVIIPENVDCIFYSAFNEIVF